MSATELMTKTEREAVRKALGQWRVPRRQIDAVLRHGVFGPGASGLVCEKLEPGVAIRVDETRDRQLAGLFEWRARLDDDQFAGQWRPTRHRTRTCCSARTRPRRSTPTR